MAEHMLKDRDILCFSSIDWDFIWQGHQEIMATLAREGNRVLFVENTGVRAAGFKDLPRLGHRMRNWWRSVKGFRQERPNLFVYSPVLLPFPYARLARWVNQSLLLRALRRWMRATGFQRPIVWTFLPTPLIRDVIRALEPQLTIYYCIDDFASSSRHAGKITQSETGLFREADLVFVTSEKLRARAAQYNPRVHLFPFGVSFAQFERARTSTHGVPAELRHLPRPVIGYVGGIHQWVDQELLAQAAQRLSHASFVLVGPQQANCARLSQCVNVHFLGQKAHAELPAYIKGFDVGIIPYQLSAYTAHVYPTKLNEYLAMGIPVVTTDLPEIRRFNAEHGDMVAIARDAAEFTEALRGAPRGSAEEIGRRIAVARRNSWEAHLVRMCALIQEALIARQAAPLRWEETLRRLYQVTRRRIGRPLLALGLAVLVLCYTPLLWVIAEPLRVAEPPRPAEAIVVFAGGTGESGQPGQGYEERVAWAVALYQRGYAKRLLFSSGSTYAFREPDVMQALAVSLGVPAAAVVIEAQSRSTRENVTNVNQVLERQGWTTALLVSSPYHMRRASLVWRRLAPGKRIIPVPVPDSLFYRHGRDGAGRRTWKQASVRQWQAVMHEYAAVVYYWLHGWV